MDKPFRIVGIGEVLFDVLPAGKQLGGAPVNFTYHAQSLGLEAFPVSAVGQDLDGWEVYHKLMQAKLPTDYVQHTIYPTGIARVSLDTNGIPHFVLRENAAWDHIQWTSDLQVLAAKTDAVCFGSLAQRSQHSRESIRRFLQHTGKNCLRIFDINLRQLYYSQEIIESSLQAADVLKLNDDELTVLQDLLKLPGSPENTMRLMQERFGLQCIALTCGARGSMLMDKKRIYECPGHQISVKDTVGAGDAFTAALAYGLLNGLPLEKINQFANKIAAYVCSQAGATPEMPDKLIDELKELVNLI